MRKRGRRQKKIRKGRNEKKWSNGEGRREEGDIKGEK